MSISVTERNGLLLDALNILDLFGHYGKITKKCGDNSAVAICPVCGHESCVAKKIYYRCADCGAEGDIVDLYGALEGVAWDRAHSEIIEKYAPWLNNPNSPEFLEAQARRQSQIEKETPDQKRTAAQAINDALKKSSGNSARKLKEIQFELTSYTSEELICLAERFGGEADVGTPTHSQDAHGSKTWNRLDLLYNPADLTEEETAPPEFLIDGIIPVGITLLYAPPKSKKSFMAYQIFEAVTNGTDFLGKKTTRCDGIYFDLEGTKRRTGDRTRRMNITIPRTSYISHELTVTVCDGLADELRKMHRERPNVRLFIIDTYSAALGNHKPSGNNAYNDDVAIWQPLHRVALSENISLVFVHHTNKQGKFASDDVMDRISGSTGLGASSDANIFISTDGGRDNNRADIMIIPRDAETQTIKARFENFRWEADERGEDFEHPIVQWCLKNAEHSATAKFYTYKHVYETSMKITPDQSDALEASKAVLNALTQSVRIKLYEQGVVVSTGEKNGKEGRGIRINKVNGMMG